MYVIRACLIVGGFLIIRCKEARHRNTSDKSSNSEQLHLESMKEVFLLIHQKPAPLIFKRDGGANISANKQITNSVKRVYHEGHRRSNNTS